MRVGILDILALPFRGPASTAYQVLLTKQFAGITPQAISVWCRRAGHATYYATYYGQGDPQALLPDDLDVVFIASYTQVSPLAYALGRLYRAQGVRTVIGGPHAKAFPVDCQRFFDIVVTTCDQELIGDIIAGHVDPGSVVASQRPFDDVPAIEERMPEIRRSAFYRGRPRAFSAVPMLASMGCPYRCDFCIDWNNPYRLLPPDRLAHDLRYLARQLPGTLAVFHDPNFAVTFEQVFQVLESQPPDQRPPYIMESSLTMLRPPRVSRLRDTNCVMVAPGVESWTDYSNKAGVGRTAGIQKVRQVADHFGLLAEQVPYLQANFMFGLDTDAGDEPVELTKQFMDRTPFVWPTINIPVPFGGTPLHDQLMADDRVLTAMPFAFYYAPYLVTTLKNYDPVDYYGKLLELYGHAASVAMLRRRWSSTPRRGVKLINLARTMGFRADMTAFRRIHRLLRSDPQFGAFHRGHSSALPEFYQHEYDRLLGRYASLLSAADRNPDLRPHQPAPGQPAGDRRTSQQQRAVGTDRKRPD